jgi:hypothetical protein
MARKCLKSKFLAVIQKGPMTKDEIIKSLGIQQPKQFHNLMYNLKKAKVNIKVNDGQYSISTGIVTTVTKTPMATTIPQKWDPRVIAEHLSIVAPEQIETSLDLLHKAYFYDAALEAQIKASTLVSAVRSIICDHRL